LLEWHEIGLAAYTGHNLPEGMEPGLKEGAFYDPLNFTFPMGCFICEVEVDPQTGKTEILKFVASDDFGTIINPMIVEGQVHGGIAQGVGQAMLEEVRYNEDGQQLSASYMDYTMPRADDLPNFDVLHHSTTCTTNPLGMKGCGEAGAIGTPPAVINAITNAIGNNDLSMPATPAKVWAALNSAKLAAE
jgi:carbon-monoxide dehydrogenase large subunit